MALRNPRAAPCIQYFPGVHGLSTVKVAGVRQHQGLASPMGDRVRASAVAPLCVGETPPFTLVEDCLRIRLDRTAFCELLSDRAITFILSRRAIYYRVLTSLGNLESQGKKWSWKFFASHGKIESVLFSSASGKK